MLVGVPPLGGGYNYITPRRADLSATAGLSCIVTHSDGVIEIFTFIETFGNFRCKRFVNVRLNPPITANQSCLRSVLAAAAGGWLGLGLHLSVVLACMTAVFTLLGVYMCDCDDVFNAAGLPVRRI